MQRWVKSCVKLGGKSKETRAAPAIIFTFLRAEMATGRRCAVYVVQDVSAVRGEIAGMGVRFAVICLVVCVAGLGIAPLWVSELIGDSVGPIVQHISSVSSFMIP